MRALNAIPLSALRTIEAIARTGAMVRAADELGVTSGALSQRLSKAEEALGQTLFIRSATGLIPTRTCLEVLPRLSRALRELNTVVEEIAAIDSGVLSVTVAPIFASRWLIWRIRDFHEQNPGISVRIEPNSEVVDLDRQAIDVGIRVGSEAIVAADASKLLDQRVFPVCSPELARGLSSPADLFTRPVIRENDRLQGWREWLAPHGLATSEIPAGPTYGDGSLCLDAAMTGQGVFMAWETLAGDALERGQIVEPFRQRTTTGDAYWFMTSRAAARKTSAIRFRNWLQHELDQSVRNWRGAVPRP